MDSQSKLDSQTINWQVNCVINLILILSSELRVLQMLEMCSCVSKKFVVLLFNPWLPQIVPLFVALLTSF